METGKYNFITDLKEMPQNAILANIICKGVLGMSGNDLSKFAANFCDYDSFDFFDCLSDSEIEKYVPLIVYFRLVRYHAKHNGFDDLDDYYENLVMVEELCKELYSGNHYLIKD